MQAQFSSGEAVVQSSVIDDATGAYLVDVDHALRLCVMGELYDPDDALPAGVRKGGGQNRSARSFVMGHLSRKFGADPRVWPLNARFFVLA